MRPNESRTRLLWNAATSYVPVFTSLLTGLLLTPIFLRSIGTEAFALWTVCNGIMAYAGLAELGIGVAVAKRVAEAFAAGQTGRLRRVLASGFLLYGGVGLALLALSALAAALLPYVIRQALPESIVAGQWCLLLLGISQCVALLSGLAMNILFGAGRGDLRSFISALSALLITVANVVLAKTGFGVVYLAGSTLVISVFAGVAVVWIAARVLRFFPFRPRLARRALAWELLRFGSRNTLLSLAGTIGFGCDTLVLARLRPTAEIAAYGIASRLATMVALLFSRPIDTLLPVYADAHASNNNGRKIKLLFSSTLAALVLALPFLAGFIAFGDGLIAAWLGNGNHLAWMIAGVMIAMNVVQLPGRASAQLMQGTEKNLLLVRAYLIAAPINLMASILFTLWLGAIGPVLASLLQIIVTDLIFLPIVACRQLEVGYGEYVRSALKPMRGPVLVAFGTAYLLAPWSHGDSNVGLQRLIAPSALGTVVLATWAFAYFTLVPPETRRSVLAYVTRRRSQLPSQS